MKDRTIELLYAFAFLGLGLGLIISIIILSLLGAFDFTLIYA